MSQLRTVFQPYRYGKTDEEKSVYVLPNHILNPQRNEDGVIDVESHHFAPLNLPSGWSKKVRQFEEENGIPFKNRVLLKCALTHASFIDCAVAEEYSLPIERMCNRSYETLGDSILGMIVSSYIFQAYRGFLEGQVTKLKSTIVNNKLLSEVCHSKLNMTDLILVDRSAMINATGRETVQAGAVESLIGAIFLDQGMDAAGDFVYRNIVQYALRDDASRERLLATDPISEFQIRLQTIYRAKLPKIDYRKVKVGHIELYVGQQKIASAQATSFKAAKILAAEQGLEKFDTLFRSPSSVSSVSGREGDN